MRSAARKAPGGAVAAAVFVALVALTPLGFVVDIAIRTGWTTIVELVFRPRVFELLVNTVLLMAIAVPVSAALGVALAWLTERTDLPGRRLWSLLAVAPLAVPAFVQGYAWIGVIPSLHGLFAAALISVLAYTPFMYLPTAAILRRLDPALEDVAASLGQTPRQIFVRVVLPQLRLPIWGGALLVSLHLLAEYGLFAMIRFDTFTTAIYDQFQSTFNGPAANMLAGVLALCCLGVLTIEAGTRGRARYARLGPGSPRAQRLVHLGPAGLLLGLALPAVMTALAIGVPMLTLTRWLTRGGAAIWRADEIVPTIVRTFMLAGLGALLTTLAAVPAAWLAIRAPSRLIRVIESANYVAGSLPGIVVALALVTVSVRYARPIYQTTITVLLAYAILFLPRALISLRASIAQAPVELENVARSLGRSPLRALWEVTLRLAAPGAAAAGALVFLAITNELTATLLLAPTGAHTLATTFWSLTSELDYAAASPYALIMVALSLPLTWILYQQSRRSAGR